MTDPTPEQPGPAGHHTNTCEPQAHAGNGEFTGPICALCGRVRCVAQSKSRPGERCRRNPKPGATVCVKHGAAAPQVAAAAAENVREAAVQAKALRVVREWQPGDLELSPVDVLVRTMTATFQQGAAHRAQLAQLLATYPDRDPYVRPDGSGPSPIAVLEQTERRLAADMAAKAITSGLAERVVRLQERQAEAVVAAMEAFARALGHDPADSTVRAAARVALLQIEGAA